MEINYKHISCRIRQERIRSQLSQEELAEMTDSSPQYISHIETGRKKASLEMVIKIANALNVTVDQLLAENLTTNQYRCDEELSRLVADCSNYERRVVLDVALAVRFILQENQWIIGTDYQHK